jgi:hypothetical protein
MKLRLSSRESQNIKIASASGALVPLTVLTGARLLPSIETGSLTHVPTLTVEGWRSSAQMAMSPSASNKNVYH